MKNKCCPYFSIVMPVYNAGKYLNKAIGSILQQSFSDFELILIEDHSRDQSYKICYEYARHDQRIQILQTKRNSGGAAARNVALNKIQGIYLLFADADDYVDKDWLWNIHKTIYKEMPDCLKMGCVEEYFNKNILRYRKVCIPGNGFWRSHIDIAKNY